MRDKIEELDRGVLEKKAKRIEAKAQKATKKTKEIVSII